MQKHIAIILAWAVLAAFPLAAAQAASSDHARPTNAQARDILARIKPLAQQGDANAQYNMGVLYDQGYGVQRNYKTAMQWYEKAAAQHYAKAEYNLGIMYQTGHGVPKNPDKAARWFRQAAEHGEPAAQNNLAVMYARGQGVPQDTDKAATWLARAARAGNASALANLPHVAAKLPRSHVDGNDVKIRALPDRNARVVRQADADAPMVLLARRDHWRQVLFTDDHTVGWVANSRLAGATRLAHPEQAAPASARAASKPAPPPQHATPVASSGSAQPKAAANTSHKSAATPPASLPKTEKPAAGSLASANHAAPARDSRRIGANGVNIRPKPTTHSKVLFQAQKGEPVHILRRSHGWRYVRFANGRTGWVAGFLLID